METSSNLRRILTKVTRKVNPSEKERTEVLSLADTLVERVKTAAKKEKIKAQTRVEGSVAKDTWLSGEPEIDIFIKMSLSTPRKAFGTVCLKIAKEATKGSKQLERFAEHPYLEAIVNKTHVNIVPCYRAKPGEWISATDRTPYHTDFVKPKLNEDLKGEIRLLKRFMKGIGIYGAEIKIGGFSGYLCELLTLQYETFVNVLKAAAAWKRTWISDYAGHYRGRENEIPKIFEEPIVVVDPVDKGRNAASAVRQERLMEFVAASRQFLLHPIEEFFYPQPLKVFRDRELIENIKTRGTAIVFVKSENAKSVPDILWGQLYKTQRSLRKMLIQNDFCVVNDAAWSDEKTLTLLLFEVETRFLATTKKHIGPPIEKRAECEKFLRKHLGAVTTVSGPRLEKGRWIVEIQRKHTDIVELLRERLKNGGRNFGVADLISKAFANSMAILVNEEVMKTYLSNAELAVFLTEYIKGKPVWLGQQPANRNLKMTR